MSIKLFYNPMSSAARIRLSLEELGVPFETVLVDLQANEQKQPEFLALNPNGKVPTIVLDGQPMFESIAIQIALGERYGVERGLWPALGSPEHLQALTWLCWGQVELASALFRYLVNSDPNRPAEERHAAVAEAARVDARRLLRILDARIGQRGNIVDERWTLVDADFSSVLGWALWMGKIDISDERHLGAWLERAQARPAHRALMAETSG